MDGAENPYVAAQRVWDDRYGGLARQRRLWQWVAAGQLVAVLVLAFALVDLRHQSKVIPYVVEVDKLGAVQALRPADPAHLPSDDRFLRYLLRTFVQGARAILTDPVAMKRTLDGVYTHARGQAKTFLDDYYRGHDPFQLAERYTAAATVHTLLPLSPKSWQVRWTEEQRAPDGRLMATTHWEGVATVEIAPPTQEEDILTNPLGLYVVDLRWTKQLEPAAGGSPGAPR